MVLRDVCMDRRIVIRDRVDKKMVLVQSLTGDLLDAAGDCCREQEGLSLGCFGEVARNGVDIIAETHVEECISLVEDELTASEE